MATRYFAVRDTLIRGDLLINRLGPYRPRLSSGDTILLYRNVPDDIEFYALRVVREWKAEEADNARNQIISLTAPEALEQPRSLAVLAGSLQKVYRFLSPERHFRRGVVSLSFQDFDTITRNLVDLDRTIFRYLFSSLPIELQSDFISRFGVESGIGEDGEVDDYGQLSERIISYFTSDLEDCFEALSWLSRAFAPLEGIENVGRLADLQLHIDRDNAIRIGEIAVSLGLVRQESPLFNEAVNRPALLREASVQLSERESGSVENKREWNEKIF